MLQTLPDADGSAAAHAPPRARGAATMSTGAALLAALLLLALWLLVAAQVNQVLPPDTLEMLGWSQSLQWGYAKHPPLAVWLLAALQTLSLSPPTAALVAAYLCLATALGFTTAIAYELAGARVAAITALLASAMQPFNWLAFFYNHNTALLAASAACVWAGLRVARQPSPARFALFGVAMGLALLTKYQAVVPIGATVLALLLAWRQARRPLRALASGLLLASLIAGALLLPHALWLLHQGASAWQYTATALAPENAPFTARLRESASFSALGARLYLPALLVLMVAAALSARGARPRPAQAPQPLTPSLRVWLGCLIGVPLAAALALALLAGVRLHAGWAQGSVLFGVIALAWLLARAPRRPGPPVPLGASLLAVHALFLLLFALGDRTPVSNTTRAAATRLLPAQQLSHEVLAQWHARFACEPGYVVGPPWEAGLVALYAPAPLRVAVPSQPGWTPWVPAADIARRGAIVIRGPAPNNQASLDAFAADGDTVLHTGRGQRSSSWHFAWRFIAPTDCATTTAATQP